MRWINDIDQGRLQWLSSTTKHGSGISTKVMGLSDVKADLYLAGVAMA